MANDTLKDSHKRSIIKSISWRILATFATITIVYLFTHKLVLSLGVGAVEMVTKMLLYYLHERAWGKVSWGRIQHPLSQLPVKNKLKPKDLEVVRDKLKDLGYID